MTAEGELLGTKPAQTSMLQAAKLELQSPAQGSDFAVWALVQFTARAL